MSFSFLKLLPWGWLLPFGLVIALLGWHVYDKQAAIAEDHKKQQAAIAEETLQKELSNAENRKLLQSSLAKRDEIARAYTRNSNDELRTVIAQTSSKFAISDCPNTSPSIERDEIKKRGDPSESYRHDPIVAALTAGYSEQRAIAMTCALKSSDIADSLETMEAK
jgi:hypothetical protein